MSFPTSVNIPEHETQVVPGVNVYCVACSWYARGLSGRLCGGYCGEGVPPCDRNKCNKAGSVNAETGDEIDPPIAGDSPTLNGKSESARSDAASPARELRADEPAAGQVSPHPAGAGVFSPSHALPRGTRN